MRRVVPVTSQVQTISERVTSKEQTLVTRTIFSLLPAVQGTAFSLAKDAVDKPAAIDRATDQGKTGELGLSSSSSKNMVRLMSPSHGSEAKEAASTLTPIEGVLDSVTWVAGMPASPSTSATLMLTTTTTSLGDSFPKLKLGKTVSEGVPSRGLDYGLFRA